jgi:hypothetical protein
MRIATARKDYRWLNIGNSFQKWAVYTIFWASSDTTGTGTGVSYPVCHIKNKAKLLKCANRI